MSKKQIKILRDGNNIVIDSVDDEVWDIVSRVTTFEEKVFLRGWAKAQAKREGRSVVQVTPVTLSAADHKGRPATLMGFRAQIRKALIAAGYDVLLTKSVHQLPRPNAYVADWKRIAEYMPSLRFKQLDALKAFELFDNGRIQCPTGWGKTFVLGVACRLFWHAKIAIATSRTEVIEQRIFPFLEQILPDVGLVRAGKRKKNNRVTCYCSRSLHHADGDEDFLFVDEGHEAAAPDYSQKLVKFHHARIFMLSASWDMRPDGTDLRATAFGGPIRVCVTYPEAVAHGMIVPLTVQVTDVPGHDICDGIDQDTEKERVGIWSNEARNKLIAADARIYKPDVQTLITVKTLEHALYLKQMLPEFKIVYDHKSQNVGTWGKFRSLGLIDDDFKILDTEGRMRLRAAFESGRENKVIATPVWNVGVDMTHLRVVVRADAGGSPINDTQIPGRGSRTKQSGDQVKLRSIIHDYNDRFSPSFHRRFNSRINSYQANEWEIRGPELRNIAELRRLVEWGKV